MLFQARWAGGITAILLLASCRGGPPDQRPASSASTPAPVESAAPKDDVGALAARVDAILDADDTSRGLPMAGRVDDPGFYRRLSLDLVGEIPSSERARAFVTDPSKDKRRKAVDELLADPRYAERMAAHWEQLLLGAQVRQPAVDRGAFRRWLLAEMKANRPWNELATELLTAEGRNSLGGRRGIDGLVGGTEMFDEEKDAGVHGAVNWLLRFGRNPQDLTGATTSLFLGQNLQCAQCHDHKTETWTTAQFESFTASFAHINGELTGPRGQGGIRQIELSDGDRPGRFWLRDPDLRRIAGLAPKTLDGTSLPDGAARRRELATWITSQPQFSRAYVNRRWAELLGEGFVDPVDDFRPSLKLHPPHEKALTTLSKGFEQSGYDTQWLTKVIVSTSAYQRSSHTTAPKDAGKAEQPASWGVYRVTPLESAELLDSVLVATAIEPLLERISRGETDKLRLRMLRQLRFAFPADEEANGNVDAQSFTMQQALLLHNGMVVNGATRYLREGALADVLGEHANNQARIAELYWRVLSRPPTNEETHRLVSIVEGAEHFDESSTSPTRGPLSRPAFRSRAESGADQAYEDLFWALLNSTEFLTNH